jgi:dipeptidyl aminopeptidase/acylaminoacyl peptidase
MQIRNGFLWVAFCLWLATVVPTSVFAQAQPTTEITPSIEDFFSFPKLANVTLSPGGNYLAATSRMNDRMNVVVIDLQTRKAQALTNFTDIDAMSVRWVGDERILFTLGSYSNARMSSERATGGGLYVVNRDGSGYRKLSERNLYNPKLIPGNNDEIIVAGNLTVRDAFDLYRLNLNTGRTTVLTLGRPAVQTRGWILDRQMVPRVAMGVIKNTNTEVAYYRASSSAEWKEIARFDADKGPALVPLAVDADDKTLIVASHKGRDTMAIFKFDPETGQFLEQLAQHAQFDMGASPSGEEESGLVFDSKEQELLGFTVNAHRPMTVWISEEHARIQALLDKAMPDRINVFRKSEDGSKALVISYSDQHPAKWFTLDLKSYAMEEVGNSRPELEGKLVKQVPFTFESRDGLKFSGYYFLPKNHVKGQVLPTIVHVHGGPFARADQWGGGFGYTEAQLFASWGYAVIVPNFRITPGLGAKNYYAGFGSYGREMLQDHEDAVNWGVKQGFVDASKVCISGASYGGYAALMGPAMNPGFYKCAISGLAPTDMKYQLTTMAGDTAYNEAGQEYWKRVIGITDMNDPKLNEVSPLFVAHKIKIPVLLYAGKADVRVPYAQIERMAEALKASGNPPWDFIAVQGEGHGFAKPENRKKLYGRVQEFLVQNLSK